MELFQKLNAFLELDTIRTIKQREAAIEDLKSALGNDHVLRKLDSESKGSKNNSGMWHELFRTSYSSLLQVETEVEDEDNKGVVATLNKQKSRESILHCLGLIAMKANRDHDSPQLKLISVLNMCKNILTVDRWTKNQGLKNTGNLFLNILMNHILPCTPYSMEMTLDQWKELLELCIELYPVVPYSEKEKVVKILEMVIKKGSSQSSLAIHIKSRLEFFENLFQVENLENYINLQDSLLKICYTIVTTLALECRLALCKFGEKILSRIIAMKNKTKADIERRQVLYKVSLVLVTLHHPGGASKDEENALAYDWNCWKTLLYKLQCCVEEDIDACARLHRSRGHASAPKLNPLLLLLAVEVYKQILNANESSETEASTSDVVQPKRRRLQGGLGELRTQLSAAQSSEQTAVRLNIIANVIKKYPTVMIQGDHLDLLQVLVNILSSCNNSSVMEQLFRCCESLLSAEKFIPMDHREETAVVHLWDKVWDMTLRAAGLNQCEESCHSLLTALLLSHRSPSLKLTPLLRLLRSGVARPQPGILRTLSVLAYQRHLQAEQEISMHGSSVMECNRLGINEGPSLLETLLRWLMPARNVSEELKFSSNVPSKELAESLVRLTMSSGMPCIEINNSGTLVIPKIVERIHEVYCHYSLKDTQSSCKISDTTTNESAQVCPTTFKIMLEVLRAEYNFLNEKLDNLCQGTNFSERVSTVQLTIHTISTYAHLLSYLLNWKVLKEDDLNGCDVTTYVSRLMQKMPEVVLTTLSISVTGSNSKHLQILESLKFLFSAKLHSTVSKYVRSQSTISRLLDTLMRIVTTTTKKRKDDIDDFGCLPSDSSQSLTISTNPHDSSVSKCEIGLNHAERKQLAAMRVISSYWFTPGINSWPSEDNEKSVGILQHVHELTKLSDEKIYLFCVLQAMNSACQAEELNSTQIVVLMEILKTLTMKKNRDQSVAQSILHILGNMFLHLNKNDINPSIEASRNIAVSMLTGFNKLITRGMFGAEVQVALVGCLEKGIEADPDQSWLNRIQAEEGSTPFVADIIEYLKSPFHEVRFEATKLIKRLFCTTAPSWDLNQYRNWHKFVFDKVCLATVTSFNQISTKNSEVMQDDLCNLTTTVLHCYCTVILANSLYRKKSLFAILQQAKLRKMNITAVKNSLTNVGKELKIPDAKSFFSVNLNFLLTQWLKLDYKFKDFPFTLLNCDSPMDFMKTFKCVVIPTVIQCRKDDALEFVLTTLQATEKEIMEYCFPQLMSQMLPFLSQCTQAIKSGDMNNTKLVYNRIIEVFGEATIEQLLMDHLENIIVCLFQLLYDPIVWQNMIGPDTIMNISQPDQPHLTMESIKHTLNYIQSLTDNPDVALLIFSTQNSPSHIQTILHQMKSIIYNAPTQEDRLKAFFQYAMFIELLTDYFESNEFKKVIKFIIRDIVYTLLNLLSTSSNATFAVAVCTVIKNLCSKCIHNLEVFQSYLPFIISTLVNVSKQHYGELFSTKIIKVIEFIVIENKEYIRKVIEKLDPFPSNIRFHKLQSVLEEVKYDMQDYSLENEIENFLSPEKCILDDRTEGLKHLKMQLSSKKEELYKMYEELNHLRGFSEDCARSNLHKLICELVRLASKQTEEAAKCLGELGPCNLTTLILKPEETFEANEPHMSLCMRKLELLAGYLVDADHNVTTNAAAALYSLLQTKEGLTALGSVQEKELFVPFISNKSKIKSFTLNINEDEFVSKLNNNEIWCPSLPCDYKEWVAKIVCAILETIDYNPEYLEQLKSLCKVKDEFASELLPRLIYVILTQTETSASLVREQIGYFFARHFEMRAAVHSSQDSARHLVYSNKKSVRCILNVVQFVRTQEHGQSHREKMLAGLDFLHVAHAALFCSSYISAIFYAELWGTEVKSKSRGATCTIDELCDNTEYGKALHEILLQSYKNIGDPDAVYGCGMSRLLEPRSRVWYFEHCNKWNRVMLMQDMGVGDAPYIMATALQQSGLHQLLRSFLGVQQQSEEVRAMQYDCCWRLGQWDLPVVINTGTHTDSMDAYSMHHYMALKSLKSGNYTKLHNDLKHARDHIMQLLVNTSLECSKNVYDSLSKLQSLLEVEDFSNVLQDRSFVIDLLNKWNQQDKIPYEQFQYIEPILSQRSTLIGIALALDECPSDLNIESQATVLLSLSQIARHEQRFHIAERALHQMKDGNEMQKLQKQLEEARCLWEQGDNVLGRHHLASLMPHLENQQSNAMYANALGLYGSWLVESSSENAHTVISQYFLKAIHILQNEQQEDQAEMANAFRTLAQFADNEFKRIDKYMKSPTFESKRQCMQKAEETAHTLSKGQSQTSDIRRAISVNIKQSRLDRSEIDNMTSERDEYLRLALEYHISSLKCADATHDVGSVSRAMFRIVSLWLENKSQLHEDSEKLRPLLEKTFNKNGLPSHLFLAVVPQLVPHLNVTTERFDSCLATLLERVAEDHPHHVLPTLLALGMLEEDAQYLSQQQQSSQPEARVLAARKMLAKLRKRPALTTILTQMETAAKALVQFAYYQYADKSEKKCPSTDIPSRHPILKICEFDQMQVSTLDLPVNKDGFYNVTGIYRYEKKFTYVGGITAPKKLVCIGTDGKKYIQLLKGLDDLHQDAVMQQVFTIVNSLLRKNEQTRKRRLLVRTYKVVPLSQRSGLIEWCENTEPIGSYLIKAHQSYHPTDYTAKTCQELIVKAQPESNEKRLQTYVNVCNKIRPVFHKFFMENFPQPGIWFERRLAYIRSVATTSMIGYVLGLGDRHVQNILIDKSTADIIHIDFGIAFEQGLVLTVPETVPFRLTRDIVDGLGISGVEGVFRRSCEVTMSVLRESQEMLLTILQVLLYDPLYTWTISPERNQNNRRGMKGARDAAAPQMEVNKLAERALLRLQQKLMGTEEGTPASVAGQVNRLIQEARDPVNLSRIFHGWKAFL